MKSKFAALAQEHSDCGSAKKGGDWGPSNVAGGLVIRVLACVLYLARSLKSFSLIQTWIRWTPILMCIGHYTIFDCDILIDLIFGRAWSLTSGILSVSTPQAPRHDSQCFQDAEGFWGSSLRSESQWIIWCGIHWFGWTSHFENPMICQKKFSLSLATRINL